MTNKTILILMTYLFIARHNSSDRNNLISNKFIKTWLCHKHGLYIKLVVHSFKLLNQSSYIIFTPPNIIFSDGVRNVFEFCIDVQRNSPEYWFLYLYFISLRSLRLCNTCICLVKKNIQLRIKIKT